MSDFCVVVQFCSIWLIAARKSEIRCVFLTLFFITATVFPLGELVQGATVTGWVENVYIYPERFVLRAKIDTGAEHSSLHATGVSYYTYQGKRWLRFWLVNRHGEKLLIKKPVTRTAQIKRHFDEIQERPVITLAMCLAGIIKTVDVNVVDRSGYDHQLLIGRSFLANDFLVDPSATDRSSAMCVR